MSDLAAISEVPQLDHHALAAVLRHLPPNTTVLAVKSLSKFWLEWARQQLKQHASTVSSRDWIPLWALRQHGVANLTTDQQDSLMLMYALVGNLEALDWLYLQLGRIPDAAVMAAITHGKLSVLKWAKDHGSDITIPALILRRQRSCGNLGLARRYRGNCSP